MEESPELLTPQVPLIRDALAALGIARVGVDGYEADDVIGTLTHRARGRHPVDVVTGDRDLFQLVDDEAQVRVLYTAKGGVRDPDLVDQGFLQSRSTASPPAPPTPTWRPCAATPATGCRGWPGIGEKTAATLINRYGDLATLRRALADGDPLLKGAQRARLEAASDYLDVAPLVVRVAADAPVEEHDADPAHAGRRPGAAVRPGLASTA